MICTQVLNRRGKGVSITCLYREDLERVKKVVKRNLDVREEVDKTEL
jgi:hypothetical protein